MFHTVEDLVRACRGSIFSRGPSNLKINRLLIDSRQVSVPDQCIFFAIKGQRQDGHDFVQELFLRGVRAFILEESHDQPEVGSLKGSWVIRVPVVLEALQRIAIYHRSKFDIPVIGITGSNGKTIVKEWLDHILGAQYRVTKSPKSYNSQIGVPLSVWQLTRSTTLGIFEAGISKTGEMVKLQEIIQPTIGIFTNIGSAHDAGFTSREIKTREKAQLFINCERVVYCADHRHIGLVLKELGVPVFSWSIAGAEADLVVENISREGVISTISYSYRNHHYRVKFPFDADTAIENGLHCLTLLHLMGHDHWSYLERLEVLEPVKMRLEVLNGINGCTVINDTYNADLESLNAALAYTRQHSVDKKKCLIITDIKQQSLPKELLYQEVANLVIHHQMDRILAIGEEIKSIRTHLPQEIIYQHFQDTGDLLAKMDQLSFNDEMILLKGARDFGLETVAGYLNEQLHQTILEVNLGALARNLKFFESLLPKGTKIMAMVKADAYGSGAVKVSKYLQTRNLDYLGVAYTDEGIELRKHSVQLPIMVMNTEIHSLTTLVHHRLEPVIYSLPMLQAVLDLQVDFADTLKIHLKLETGMQRLGFDTDLLERLKRRLIGLKNIEVGSVFSHLAASDDSREAAFTRKQIHLFHAMADAIDSVLGYRPLRHILNSNGVYFFPEEAADMVRLGIGIYGIGMPAGLDLEKVHQLKTSISQIHTVRSGESIGYSRGEFVTRDTQIATIGIGYADGLIRKAGNRRYALVVNGARAPIVGNICMDMTMLDVTGIPNVEIGTEVIVFGQDPTIGSLAEAAETIPYEILTSLSTRIKRIYIDD